MTNINLTEKETALMIALASLADEDTAEAQLADGPVFATADELSSFAKMEVKSVKSVTNSLIKKGFVIKNDEAERYELTEAGVVWAFDQRPKEGENEPTLSEDEAVAAITASLRDALAQDGATKCSALRAVAKECVTGRALFIAAAEAVGINKGTAARQWQEGRAEEGPADDKSQELIEAATAALGEMAPDEILAKLLPLVPRKALAALIKE